MSNEHSFHYAYSGQLVFSKIPDLEINIQRMILPSQAIGVTDVPMGAGKIHELPGTSFVYEPLRVAWIAKEDLSIYWAINDWLRRLASPTSNLGDNEYTDASILVSNNSGELIETISFRNIFPNSLSELPYNFDEADPPPIKLNASFTFEAMERTKNYNYA